MGLTEEAGGVARRAVGVLAGAPMLFALVLVNFATFAMTTYLVASAIQNRAKERQQVLIMLEKCYSERR